jgi:hypothetical protein
VTDVIVVGTGTIAGRNGDLWAIDSGRATLFIVPANMLLADPKIGDTGLLTYEYRGFSRVNCFRAIDASSPSRIPPR